MMDHSHKHKPAAKCNLTRGHLRARDQTVLKRKRSAFTQGTPWHLAVIVLENELFSGVTSIDGFAGIPRLCSCLGIHRRVSANLYVLPSTMAISLDVRDGDSITKTTKYNSHPAAYGLVSSTPAEP
jgi:hypothetical protein